MKYIRKKFAGINFTKIICYEKSRFEAYFKYHEILVEKDEDGTFYCNVRPCDKDYCRIGGMTVDGRSPYCNMEKSVRRALEGAEIIRTD